MIGVSDLAQSPRSVLRIRASENEKANVFSVIFSAKWPEFFIAIRAVARSVDAALSAAARAAGGLPGLPQSIATIHAPSA